jgi:hypothetical protein
MPKEWTVDKSHEWKLVEWDNRYHRPEVRPKFTNYWLAHGEACLLNHASVTPVDYYYKPDQRGRCERAS